MLASAARRTHRRWRRPWQGLVWKSRWRTRSRRGPTTGISAPQRTPSQSKGSKAVDHYLSQYTRHLSNIGENSADMFICKSYTQLATMLSKASTIPTLEPKEHVPNWTHTYGMKIYGEEKGPSLQSLGKLGNCNLFMEKCKTSQPSTLTEGLALFISNA
ncbi:uncharacterized protein LOC125537478 isoform X1 [Triticum urartu]|uniref:uncharacterized protein LOC125537478 isoform X1 n=1 Tax=Triticum urartu TaxID=4572 RepID=UPI002043C3DF|nr:uncharacterized protein LOC125537478 isoform X1 [Triticum urartu]